MSSNRRWHNQPPRDDFVVHQELGVATVRTDHPDGTATFSVQVAEPGFRGLYLTSDLVVRRDQAGFTAQVPGARTRRQLADALREAARHLTTHLTAAAAA